MIRYPLYYLVLFWMGPPYLSQGDDSMTGQCPGTCRTYLGIQTSRESSLDPALLHAPSATCPGWDIHAFKYGIIFAARKSTLNYLVQFTLLGRSGEACDKMYDQAYSLCRCGRGSIFLSQNHYLLPTYTTHNNTLFPVMLFYRFLVSGPHYH